MKKFIIITIVTLFCSILAFASFLTLELSQGEYNDFQKSKIIEILSKESVLYYSDGQNQLGSLFGQEHRLYVTIDHIPQVMKTAIVSAEDETFYTNYGINPKGILRAFIHNLFSHSRQGASTITQQTVKNLFGRKEVNLYVKFQEMINAFKMEKMFTKDQILEFYLNQFHVTGNGRGVGVAAKYYFNKPVDDLDLVEAAFIAGSVKGPEKYNPFTKTSHADQQKARANAMQRKNYVLERMYKDNKITLTEYKKASQIPVPFNQGRFQYNEIAVNQIILKQLSRREILTAIGAESVDELGTMGLRITTTIDKDVQTAAKYGLKKNLSRIQQILSGFSFEKPERFIHIQKPELYGFYVGKITAIKLSPGRENINISLGVPECQINTDSLNDTALTLDQTSKSGLEKAKRNLFGRMRIGQYVLASIKNITPTGMMYCDLEIQPRLQGAALVLDKGKIVAMSGGFSSNEYNRAIFAKRQPGSSFKIPTYYAAQQLGWSILDSLPNIRDVFPWQGKFYFPRPDHHPITLKTTILGAGAKSENLASVWVLRHMLDKLDYNQFLALLNFLGFGQANHSLSEITSLMANKFNATAHNVPNIKEGILEKIKEDLLSDSSNIKNRNMEVFLYTLHFGKDFKEQSDFINNDPLLSSDEKDIRKNLLRNNLLRWSQLAEKAQNVIVELKKWNLDQPLPEALREQLSFFSKTDSGNLVFTDRASWQPELATRLASKVRSTAVDAKSFATLLKDDSSRLDPDNVLLDGVVPISFIVMLNEKLDKKWEEVRKSSELERLYWNADLRYSLAMYYVAKMASAMGVLEPLQWIPSLPLGSNSVTLADLSLVYQTFLQGKTYQYFNEDHPNQLLLIKRIEDTNGNLLWEPHAKEAQLADPFYSAPTLDIMRSAVTGGTARVLNKSIILRSSTPNLDAQLQRANIKVPVFGKTGTTNDYKNGTFIGFLPYPQNIGDGLSADNAYTIASYIGYDTNESMVRKGYKVYGGGAIPAWQEIALAIIKSQHFAEKLNWTELNANKQRVVPFNYGSGVSAVEVPMNSGIPISHNENDEENTPQTDTPYSNDYSDVRDHIFKIYIAGSESFLGNFTPTRKISFFSSDDLASVSMPPISSFPAATTYKDSDEVDESTAKLENSDENKEEKSSTSQPESAGEEKIESTAPLPPPPPNLQKR